jgi:ABC-type transporter MlaC component
MPASVVFGLDVVQFVTTVSAFVTTAMVSYIALKVRQAANEVLRTIEANRRRSKRHKRVIFGDDGIPGLTDRVSNIEEETDA